MRGEWDLARAHCKSAELADQLNVRLGVARVGRADINQGPVAELFTPKLLERVLARQVQIAFRVLLRKPTIKSRDGHAYT